MARMLPLLLVLALAACDPGPAKDPGHDPLAVLGDRRGEWESAEADAETAFALGRWQEAAALFERKISLVPAARPGAVDLAGRLSLLVRQDLYNLACCRALLGRPAAALDALEQSVEEGPGFIGIEHLLEDPDLASLRGEARWKALVERLTWNEEVTVLPPEGAGEGPVAAVVEIRDGPPGGKGGRRAPGAVTAVPAPPYREGPGRLAWTTRLDPGEQAARKAVFALEAAGRVRPLDPGRRVLLASGASAVRLAWEILLRRPGAFTRAVLDGPAPPDWVLLDRGADRVKAEVLVAGPEGLPAQVVGVNVRVCGSLEAAVAEALR
jgi:hypothetical protein